MKSKFTHNHHNETDKNQRVMLMNDIKLNTFILRVEMHLMFMEIILIFMAHPQINNRLLKGDEVIDFIKMENIQKEDYLYFYSLFHFQY